MSHPFLGEKLIFLFLGEKLTLDCEFLDNHRARLMLDCEFLDNHKV
jgi:hypothetical protein